MVSKKAKKAKTKSSKSTSEKEEVRKPSAVDAWLKKAAADQSYKGRIQIKKASDYATVFHLRRPTGIIGVDVAIGGGFPAGGSSQIFGVKSSGKTHLAFRTAAQVQKTYQGDSCILIALTEHKMDIGFARMAGFQVPYSADQIAEFSQIREKTNEPPFTAAEILDLKSGVGQVLILEAANAGDLFDGVLETMNTLGSALQLVIVDSFGSLLTPEAEEKDTGDKLYGGSAGVITRFTNKLHPLFIMDRPEGLLETTVIAINQVRARIGAPRPGMTQPAAGSKAWEHAQLINLELKQGEPIWQDRSHKEHAGREIKWELKKGKAGCREGVKGTYDWLHPPSKPPVFNFDVAQQSTQYGIDALRDLVETAKKLGVIETAGSWYTLRGDNDDVLFKSQGLDPFVQLVVSDPQTESYIYDRCLKAAKLTVRYR